LALFERRPLQRAQTIVIAGVRKPAQNQTPAPQQKTSLDHLVGALL
jgi:hypothetical protein